MSLLVTRCHGCRKEILAAAPMSHWMLLKPDAKFSVTCPECGVSFLTIRLYCYTRSDEAFFQDDAEIISERSQDELSSLWQSLQDGNELETEDGFTISMYSDRNVEQTMQFRKTLPYSDLDPELESLYYTRTRENPDAVWEQWFVRMM